MHMVSIAVDVITIVVDLILICVIVRGWNK